MKKDHNISNKKIFLIVAGITIIFTILLILTVILIKNYQKSDFEKFDNLNDSEIDYSQVQNVKLVMVDGWRYVLEPSQLKKNVPVRMEVDLTTVRGCMRDIVIKDFKVRQVVNSNNNVITFVPTKSGTIYIACSMNMGQGTFTVID